MDRRLVLLFGLLIVYALALLSLQGAQAGYAAPEGIVTAHEFCCPAVSGVIFFAPLCAYLLAFRNSPG
jgi:hypothetical protein